MFFLFSFYARRSQAFIALTLNEHSFNDNQILKQPLANFPSHDNIFFW